MLWLLKLTRFPDSGIFGYVNYLVEKDRKFIIDTLINGTLALSDAGSGTEGQD